MLLKQFQKNQKQLLSTLKYSITTQEQQLGLSLSEKDPELKRILGAEENRQKFGINLIASENHCSKAVLNALATPVMNNYSNGLFNDRFSPGTKQIDEIEGICQKRALEAFNLDPKKWGVNVQAYSGCHANFAVFGGILKPHDRILGLDLPHGGHLSHGFQIKNKKISMVSQYFESYSYKLNEETGVIDYNSMRNIAENYFPKVIIAGASAYSRLIDYQKFREVADSVGAYVLADQAHISGLVAAGVIPSPFEYADIVTTTTHKSLRGPRGALIFYRKGLRSVTPKGKKIFYKLEEAINYSVSPQHQSSPHNNQIAAIAVALKQAQSPEFKQYQQQVMSNCTAFCQELDRLGYSLVSGGTDNHLVLINLKKNKLDGARAEKILDLLHIYGNKNTVPGDKSALNPGGYRVGTPAMTTRGLEEKDFVEVANFMDKAFQLIPKLKEDCGGKKVVDFSNYIVQNENDIPELVKLKQEIIDFSSQFPVPSLD